MAATSVCTGNRRRMKRGWRIRGLFKAEGVTRWTLSSTQAIASHLELFLYLPISFYLSLYLALYLSLSPSLSLSLSLSIYLSLSLSLSRERERERQRERETCVYLSQECRLLFLRWLAATNKRTNMQECSAAFLYRHSILA